MDCYTQNQENHRSALRFIRVKDVGTRMTSQEQRNKKIVQAAEPLPEGNQLPARVIYWFVTNEEVEIYFSHNKFHWLYSFPVVTEEGTTYYLNQIEFRKSGIVEFGFSDGHREQCYSMAKQSSTKKMKVNQGNNSDAQMNYESQSPQISVPETPNNHNNADETIVYDGNGLTRAPYPASRDLIVNILLLVPDMNELIDTLDKELTKIDFKKEVSSINQHLYSRVNSTYKQFHVLVLPYGKLNQYYKVAEYLQYTTEVILMVEDSSQQNGLMAVECVANVNYTPHYTWQFEVKTQSFKKTTLDFATLDPSVTLLFQIEELQQASKGGASCSGVQSLEGSLSRYILEWTLRPVTKSTAQMIYICFKYEPRKVKAFGEYAAASLAALGIEYDFEPLVTHGSVLVYIRCPAYIPWYIMMRKDTVFNALADLGLTEIYECFISDADASLQRPENAELVDELMFLKEQMISDGIEEQLAKRFRAEKDDIAYHLSDYSQVLTVTISKDYRGEESWSNHKNNSSSNREAHVTQKRQVTIQDLDESKNNSENTNNNIILNNNTEIKKEELHDAADPSKPGLDDSTNNTNESTNERSSKNSSEDIEKDHSVNDKSNKAEQKVSPGREVQILPHVTEPDEQLASDDDEHSQDSEYEEEVHETIVLSSSSSQIRDKKNSPHVREIDVEIAKHQHTIQLLEREVTSDNTIKIHKLKMFVTNLKLRKMEIEEKMDSSALSFEQIKEMQRLYKSKQRLKREEISQSAEYRNTKMLLTEKQNQIQSQSLKSKGKKNEREVAELQRKHEKELQEMMWNEFKFVSKVTLAIFIVFWGIHPWQTMSVIISVLHQKFGEFVVYLFPSTTHNLLFLNEVPFVGTLLLGAGSFMGILLLLLGFIAYAVAFWLNCSYTTNTILLTGVMLGLGVWRHVVTGGAAFVTLALIEYIVIRQLKHHMNSPKYSLIYIPFIIFAAVLGYFTAFNVLSVEVPIQAAANTSLVNNVWSCVSKLVFK